MMDQNAKAKFILALHKHSLQAFGAGGPVNGNMTSGGILGIPGALTNQNQYQAQLAPTDYTSYGPTINEASGNALAGYGTSQNILAQQQGLANQLQAETQGAGPNPAQAALNQATGQNVATQAALMAGERGAAANAGLLARQSAQQGAATQQNAVGQGATLQAQQQLAAQQQLEAQQQAMQSGNVAEQGLNAGLFGTAASAQNTQNANSIQNYAMSQGIDAQIAQNNANAVNKTQGGLLNSLGSAIGGPIKNMFSDGGMVEKYPHLHAVAKIYHPKMYSDGGGIAQVNVPNIMSAPDNSPSALSPQGLGLDKSSGKSGSNPLQPSEGTTIAGDPSSIMEAAPAAALLASKGGKVPGKAKVKDDSKNNDTVPAMLSPKEIVLPRSVTTHPNAPQKAAEFVQAVLNKRKMGKK